MIDSDLTEAISVRSDDSTESRCCSLRVGGCDLGRDKLKIPGAGMTEWLPRSQPFSSFPQTTLNRPTIVPPPFSVIQIPTLDNFEVIPINSNFHFAFKIKLSVDSSIRTPVSIQGRFKRTETKLTHYKWQESGIHRKQAKHILNGAAREYSFRFFLRKNKYAANFSEYGRLNFLPLILSSPQAERSELQGMQPDVTPNDH